VYPYDYWPASGIRKSSLAARLVLAPSGVPVLGATIMRLRNRYVSDRIFEGGLSSPEALPKELAEELYEVGARPGHYRGFLSLLAHERLWPKARDEYASIKVPVLLVYGEQDWAPPGERERTRSLIPGVTTEIVRNGNHFLSLDRPQELQHLIVRFAGN
jgi:pimeloyl-ACP methyl ester carboxylesterase